jgi:hypothetical protein
MSLLQSGSVVLGTANGVSLGSLFQGGALNAFLASQLSGLTALGVRYAAAGGQLVKGVMVWQNPSGGTYSTFAFPMNPESINDSVQPDWATKSPPGQNAPLFQFTQGGEREVSFTLHFFFQDRNRGKIRDQIRALQSLTRRPITGTATHTATGSPPVINFFYGELYKGERFIVKKVDARMFGLFDPVLLLPMQAEVEISLVEAPDPTATVPKVRLTDRLGPATSIIRAGF